MTKVIHKHPFGSGAGDRITVLCPTDGTVVHVGFDPNGVLCVWIAGTGIGPFEHREYSIIGTGQAFGLGTPVGSVPAGPFIWHVLEHRAPAPTGTPS